MGHILIPKTERVNNDLSLHTTGQYGLVTGANMAGKSTFLRTVGVNLVLAQAGAPVCARSFRWKPATIFTSMRATDSVQDRASYFYAELIRLRRIAELLKGGTEAYILLDEILRGTNSKDKAEGSKGFIEQLVNWPGMGLVATHDLSLAALEEVYPDKIKNLRFEIEIEGDKLHCSYKLQPGVSQNLNATFLMKQMGIVK
jgi:DNA mismatch repair ATPase MutS